MSRISLCERTIQQIIIHAFPVFHLALTFSVSPHMHLLLCIYWQIYDQRKDGCNRDMALHSDGPQAHQHTQLHTITHDIPFSLTHTHTLSLSLVSLSRCGPRASSDGGGEEELELVERPLHAAQSS